MNTSSSVSKQQPSLYGTADKVLRFGVSDAGDFLDTVYREQQSSKLFGKIIGRQTVTVHGKGVFSAADIVCEGYLFKKGSWLKNWKRRYFILRRDIRSLCYYSTREDMTLLGSIPLDIDTRLMNIKPEDADGFQNVIAIETDFEEGPLRTYVRFESFEKMKSWMLDIKSEAQNMVAATDESWDWWKQLFDHVETWEPKVSSSRRDGVTAEHDHHDEIKTPSTPTPVSASEKVETGGVLDSDEDSDDENKSTRDASLTDKARTANTLQVVNNGISKAHKKIKHMKAEKPPGPPPFEHPLADRFETASGTLSGYQFSLSLSNICAFQDRLFLVVFGSNLNDPQSLAAAAQSAQIGAAAAAAGKRPSALPGNRSGKWTELGRSEIRMVTERPAYSESFVGDVKIFFSALQGLIPEQCKEIKVVVYRQETKESRDGGGADLRVHQIVARQTIPRAVLEQTSILKVNMKVQVQMLVDIAVPYFKDGEVTLGILKLSSAMLQQHRTLLSKCLHTSPYAEIMYSFASNAGVTLSLEALYASKYGTAVGQAMISMLGNERQHFMQEHVRQIKEQFASSLRNRSKESDVVSTESMSDEKLQQVYESQRAIIENVEDIFNETCELASIIHTNFENVSKGKEVKNNVIDVALGGGVLRRSVWKKITTWQYCTTNLNLHILMNKFIPSRDIDNRFEEVQDSNSHRSNLWYTPTITLGCPAAHELGFSEGGLRRLFADVPLVERKLEWMQAIQAPDLSLLSSLFVSHPKEAASIFGSKCCSLATTEDVTNVLRRKADITRRLDMCASQALGCAAMTVRSICLMATMIGGNFLDILARSLKIGFLVLFESFLSTQGAEVGMLEDLEMSALWLSLVSVRLVCRSEVDCGLSTLPNELNGAQLKNSPKTVNRKVNSDGQTVFAGYGDGLALRRDTTGRLILDIDITLKEADTITSALQTMGSFEYMPSKILTPSNVQYAFQTNPEVRYATNEQAPRVIAVAELFGLAFTQGVNEMQTLANLSSSRDVVKQAEINMASMSRLREFYVRYRSVLEFQLLRQAPAMIEALQQQSTEFDTVDTTNLSHTRGMTRRKSTLMRPSLHANAQSSTQMQMLSIKVSELSSKVLSFNDRLIDQLQESILNSNANPYEKHVDVLMRTGAVGRQICGINAILCKSGKDRTSMGVTLENTCSLVEDLGVYNGQEICQLMRYQGVRRMNVYANTGQSMFAFNQIQRRALPACYRPPPGCHAGNIAT